MIILFGIGSFIKEYIRAEITKDKFTIKEDYLEALLKFFEHGGKLIESKDRVSDLKENAETCKDKEIIQKIETMINEL